jgi:hypothetical protein
MESPADSMMFREMDDVRGPTRRVEESIRPSTAPVGGRSQVGDPATMMDAKNTFYNAMNNKTRTIQNTSVGKLAKYYTELMLMFRALFVVSSFFS